MTAKYLNRDISWLEFNRRVLFQAEDPTTPLLERLRFLSIFTSNLDEFFMKRVGRLQSMISRDVQLAGSDGMYPAETMTEIHRIVVQLLKQKAHIYKNNIIPELTNNGLLPTSWRDLNDSERETLKNYFDKMVFPTLTPLSVDRSHPFPFLSNLSLSLGMKIHHPNSDDLLFARVKIPDDLPQWVPLHGDVKVRPLKLVRMHELIEHNLDKLFPKMVIAGVTPFRITRNADTALVDDEQDDVVEVVEEELRRRRFARVVRLEYFESPDPWVMDFLINEIAVNENQIYELSGEINYRGLDDLWKLEIPELKYRTWVPVSNPKFSDDNNDIFQSIRESDILVHHPYENFSTSVERFIQAAVDDPHVFTIKMTMYRTSAQSKFIPLLIEAAERGKQVVCVMEVKARFDEARNLRWAEKLEGAGVHVVYGVTGLKTHAKLALVVRREQGGFNFYAHVGTGNYNEQTAKTYTDLGLFTCNTDITADIIEVFNSLTGISLKEDYKALLVSPVNMRASFTKLIQKEIANKLAGKPAGIIAKMNSIEDMGICDLLYEASQAGVPIRLLVRGFCSLRAGVPGLSENVEVYSIVGRFLEHARIFYFRSGMKKEEDGKIFIGSPDWMRRNINDRVEVITPILEPTNKKKCFQILSMQFQDMAQRWKLEANGTYTLLRPDSSVEGSQSKFMQLVKDKKYFE